MLTCVVGRHLLSSRQAKRAGTMTQPWQTSVVGEGRAALCDGDETSLGMAASFSAYGVAGRRNGIGERNVDTMRRGNCQDGPVTPVSIIPQFCVDCGVNWVGIVEGLPAPLDLTAHPPRTGGVRSESVSTIASMVFASATAWVAR